jgi:hypothetical protein
VNFILGRYIFFIRDHIGGKNLDLKLGWGKSWKDLPKDLNKFKFEMTQNLETPVGVG